MPSEQLVAPLNLRIAKGDAVTIRARHLTGPGGEPVDITDQMIVFSVRRLYRFEVGSGTLMFSKACTVLDGPDGQYEIPLSHGEMNIANGEYLCAIWRMDLGFERRWAAGTLTVEQDAAYGG